MKILKINMKKMYVLFFGMITFSCNQKTSKKEFDTYYVQAFFDENSNNINGLAKYYDYTDILLGTKFFENGVENGPAVLFYRNGQLKDSLFYDYGKINGYRYHFDTSGILSYVDYYHYHIKMGPHLYYHNEHLWKYFFTDMSKTDLVYAEYDSNGIDILEKYDMNARAYTGMMHSNSIVSFFSYLPRIPMCETIFKIGKIDGVGKQTDLFVLENENIFVDTVLPSLDIDEYYYISSHIKSNNGKVNRVYIEEVIQKK